MTVEEAYKFAEKPLKCEEASAELKEFCAIARGAIFRQIAKKPVNKHCPVCSSKLVISYYAGISYFNFCPSCGQKIDWSDNQ